MPLFRSYLLSACLLSSPPTASAFANGVVEGTGPQPSGVREFKGVPFAQPPVGDFRWAPPQPVKNWTGVKQTTAFGPRCMQQALFGDMGFRSNGMSEDCLYLNVWTPAKSASAKLPVMVYFFGGGFQAGDGSEPRYDGESMAAKGIVAVSVSYRLGIFGFFAHPDLTKESPHHASGNYAVTRRDCRSRMGAQEYRRVRRRSREDHDRRRSLPASIAQSALMASPTSRDLIAGAIGESGFHNEILPPSRWRKRRRGWREIRGTLIGASTVLRNARHANHSDFDAAAKQGAPRFSPTTMMVTFARVPAAIFAAGKTSARCTAFSRMEFPKKWAAYQSWAAGPKLLPTISRRGSNASIRITAQKF